VSTWVGSMIWQPTKWFQVSSGVIDSGASAENFADNFFKTATFFQQYTFAYKIAEKPGNLRLIWALNTKDGVDLEDPLNFTSVDGRPRINFRNPIRRNDSSFAFMANFDQYLFTIDPKASQEDPQSSETSQHHSADRVYVPTPGLGVFGRFGIGPESQNLISLFGSFGISGVGLIPGREYDQFGFGWYYVGISDDLSDFINDSTLLSDALPVDGADENGLEAYYNFAITPAMQLSADVQYIFNPEFSTEKHTLILGGRLQIDF
ncbi:MAG: carbohydrate porin, partial [Waterburya sp.]